MSWKSPDLDPDSGQIYDISHYIHCDNYLSADVGIQASGIRRDSMQPVAERIHGASENHGENEIMKPFRGACQVSALVPGQHSCERPRAAMPSPQSLVQELSMPTNQQYDTLMFTEIPFQMEQYLPTSGHRDQTTHLYHPAHVNGLFEQPIERGHPNVEPDHCNTAIPVWHQHFQNTYLLQAKTSNTRMADLYPHSLDAQFGFDNQLPYANLNIWDHGLTSQTGFCMQPVSSLRPLYDSSHGGTLSATDIHGNGSGRAWGQSFKPHGGGQQGRLPLTYSHLPDMNEQLQVGMATDKIMYPRNVMNFSVDSGFSGAVVPCEVGSLGGVRSVGARQPTSLTRGRSDSSGVRYPPACQPTQQQDFQFIADYDMGIASSMAHADETQEVDEDVAPLASAPKQPWTAINGPKTSSHLTAGAGNGANSVANELPSHKKKKRKAIPSESTQLPVLPVTTEALRSSLNLATSNSASLTSKAQANKKKRKRVEVADLMPDVVVPVTSIPPVAKAPPPQKVKSTVIENPIPATIPSSVERTRIEKPSTKKKRNLDTLQFTADAASEAGTFNAPAKARKDKSAQSAQELPKAGNEADDGNHVATQARPAKFRRKARGGVDDNSPRKKGPFSADEFAALDKAIVEIQTMNNISKEDMNNHLHANGNNLAQNKQAPANIWNIICAAVPDRPRQSVQKCVRRKYYNCVKRAGWNDEEDSELLDAYLQWPNQWRKIGEALGRHEEECRYRYRDYLKCGPDQRFDMWDGEEEQKMLQIVGDLRKLAEKDHERNVKVNKTRGAFDSANFQPNFNIVAERMGTRSRLQCSNKYGKMMSQEEKANDSSSSKGESKKRSQRVALAEKNFREKMTYGDKYECLKAILDGLIKYKMTKEEKIPWGEIQKANRSSRWESAERRIVFQEYKSIAKTNSKASAVDQIKDMIRFMERKHSKALLSTFYPGIKQKRQSSKGTRKHISKSKATVSDSDADDSGEDIQNGQVHKGLPSKSANPRSVASVPSNETSSGEPSNNSTSDSSSSDGESSSKKSSNAKYADKISSKVSKQASGKKIAPAETSSEQSSSSTSDASTDNELSVRTTSSQKSSRAQPSTKKSGTKISPSKKSAARKSSSSSSNSTSSEPSSASESTGSISSG